MLKVLIVEDEFLVRVGLRSLIDWSGNGFELLEDAIDGEQAMRQIRESLPDIILLDIQLPGMNGLQVLREIRELNICTKVVVISCNDEFEAVKQAMAYGAVDYLRKLSLNRDDLMKVLLEIKDSICQAEEPGAESVPDPQSRDLEWVDVLTGERDELPENTKLQSGYAMFLDVDAPDAHFYALNYSVFVNVIRQSLRAYRTICTVFRSGPSTFCVLFRCEFSPEALAKKVQMQLHQTVGVDCSIGIGPKWTDAQSLRACIVAAKQISYYKFYCGGGVVRSFVSAGELENPGAARKRNWSAVIDALQSDSWENIQKMLEEAWTDMTVPCTLYPDSMKILCTQLLGRIQTALKLQEREGKNSDFQQVMSAQTAEQVKEYLFFRAEEMIQSVEQKPHVRYSRLIVRAIDYIDSHITQPSSLSRVAKEINVSESYFSMLFKKEVGENCIAYINRKKVEAAMAMLDEDYLIYEVAEKLGFDNSNYFGKVFKKYTGLTPEQYRKK